MHKVFVKTNEKGHVIAVNSEAFIPNTQGWTLIDKGAGVKFHHAQGNYFPKPYINENGTYRYQLVNGKIIERTQEEMDADFKPVEPTPSIDERMKIIETAIQALFDLLNKFGISNNKWGR